MKLLYGGNAVDGACDFPLFAEGASLKLHIPQFMILTGRDFPLFAEGASLKQDTQIEIERLEAISPSSLRGPH